MTNILIALQTHCAENVQWILSGIGTQIIFFIISFLLGGTCGYCIGIRVKNKQIQKAGNNAIQTMTGNTTNVNGSK